MAGLISVAVNAAANYVLISASLAYQPWGCWAAWGTVVAVFVQLVLGIFVVVRGYWRDYHLGMDMAYMARPGGHG